MLPRTSSPKQTSSRSFQAALGVDADAKALFLLTLIPCTAPYALVAEGGGGEGGEGSEEGHSAPTTPRRVGLRGASATVAPPTPAKALGMVGRLVTLKEKYERRASSPDAAAHGGAAARDGAAPPTAAREESVVVRVRRVARLVLAFVRDSTSAAVLERAMARHTRRAEARAAGFGVVARTMRALASSLRAGRVGDAARSVGRDAPRAWWSAAATGALVETTFAPIAARARRGAHRTPFHYLDGVPLVAHSAPRVFRALRASCYEMLRSFCSVLAAVARVSAAQAGEEASEEEEEEEEGGAPRDGALEIDFDAERSPLLLDRTLRVTRAALAACRASFTSVADMKFLFSTKLLMTARKLKRRSIVGEEEAELLLEGDFGEGAAAEGCVYCTVQYRYVLCESCSQFDSLPLIYIEVPRD